MQLETINAYLREAHGFKCDELEREVRFLKGLNKVDMRPEAILRVEKALREVKAITTAATIIDQTIEK